jgi:hypothetical protein
VIKTLALLLVATSMPLLGALVTLRLVWAAFTAPERAWLILIAVDDLMNVVTNGWLGQTISKRAADARAEGKRWGCVLCRWLDEAEPGHCDKALADVQQNLSRSNQ